MSIEDWCNMVGWTRNHYFYRLRRLRELAIQSTFDSGVFAKIPDELSEEHAPAADEHVTIRSGVISIETSSNTFKENTLFLFCGRRCDRIKGLVWEGLSEYSDKKVYPKTFVIRTFDRFGQLNHHFFEKMCG